jgi:hypothetical protein
VFYFCCPLFGEADEPWLSCDFTGEENIAFCFIISLFILSCISLYAFKIGSSGAGCFRADGILDLLEQLLPSESPSTPPL